ncbi:hypothetical protein BWR18_13340 [Tateyamaria omphalii]|uniref:Uncharacterized protein n=2 Tax=Tateyamaria omphalii TaxID=299262 RepID=A0A1P8MX20_9RHOB|nr:hypothetical protein BWR18_13340 [Tateyamaria omphalii]
MSSEDQDITNTNAVAEETATGVPTTASVPDNREGSTGLRDRFFKVITKPWSMAVGVIFSGFLIAAGFTEDAVSVYLKNWYFSARQQLVLPVVEKYVKTQISDADSELSKAIVSTLERRLSQNIGAVVAGSTILSNDASRHTIPLYLRPGHAVDLALDVKGLEAEQEIQIIYKHPHCVLNSISRLREDDDYHVQIDLSNNCVHQKDGIVRRLGTEVDNYFPVQVILTISEEAAKKRELDTLSDADVYIEYLAFVSPPFRNVLREVRQ